MLSSWRVAPQVEALGGGTIVEGISLDPILTPDSSREWSSQELMEYAQRHRKNKTTGLRSHGAELDAVCQFDEISAAGGQLGRFPGSEIFPILKQLVQV